MSSKKTITVRTQPQEVEIEGNIITNDELKVLYQNIRGGNGEKTTAELLRHLAVNVLDASKPAQSELIRSCHYRAAAIEDALENVQNMIWPKDQVETVLEITLEKSSETAA